MKPSFYKNFKFLPFSSLFTDVHFLLNSFENSTKLCGTVTILNLNLHKFENFKKQKTKKNKKNPEK